MEKLYDHGVMSSESLDYFEIQIVRHSFRTKRSSENLKKLDEIKDKIQKEIKRLIPSSNVDVEIVYENGRNFYPTSRT